VNLGGKTMGGKVEPENAVFNILSCMVTIFILQDQRLSCLWSPVSTTTNIYSSNYINLRFQIRMANAHLHSRNFGFGDFEQKQNKYNLLPCQKSLSFSTRKVEYVGWNIKGF
jgi:hypothetical protein